MGEGREIDKIVKGLMEFRFVRIALMMEAART
jgi:hypothetical protein